MSKSPVFFLEASAAISQLSCSQVTQFFLSKKAILLPNAFWKWIDECDRAREFSIQNPLWPCYKLVPHSQKIFIGYCECSSNGSRDLSTWQEENSMRCKKNKTKNPQQNKQTRKQKLFHTSKQRLILLRSNLEVPSNSAYSTNHSRSNANSLNTIQLCRNFACFALSHPFIYSQCRFIVSNLCFLCPNFSL